jgi:hypothetical protein
VATLLWLASAPIALGQTPGPPPVPLGEPMSRELGEPGSPYPPMPEFESEEGKAKLETEPSKAAPEETHEPSDSNNNNDQPAGEGQP